MYRKKVEFGTSPHLEEPVHEASHTGFGPALSDNNLALLQPTGPEIDVGAANKLHHQLATSFDTRVKIRLLTFVRLKTFQRIIGTIKIGMPTYEAKKSEVDQLPLRNTGKPATRVMIVEPMKPTHAVYGWKGDCQGKVSRLTPCAFMAE